MTNFLRGALKPRFARPFVITTASAAALCAAFVLGTSLSRPRIVVTPPPVTTPAPHVTVTPAPVVLPTPSPPVAVEPPASSAVEVPPAAPPRALTPVVDPACVAPSPGGEPSPTCAWDDGFPAISADGTLIATKYAPPTGESGLFGLSIHFIDTKTSRLVRDVVILTVEESGPFVYPDDTTADARQTEARRRVQAAIERRVAAVQRTIDAKPFRSMRLLGAIRSDAGGDESTTARGTGIYAEIVGTTARIIDPAASSVLWRSDFHVAGPKRSEDAVCGGWSPWSTALWWDPDTRYVLASSTYRTGGCMCSDVPVESVQQMP